MKKLIFTFIATFGLFSSLLGQTIAPVVADPTPFLGTWKATSGNYTYELTMIRDTMLVSELQSNVSRDMGYDGIVCRLIYKQGNTVIRTIEPNGARSMLLGTTTTTTVVDLRFNDTVRKITGVVKFTLSANSPTVAIWELRRPDMYYTQEGGATDYDIPRNLTFRKVLSGSAPIGGGNNLSTGNSGK